ncbi:class II aldolase/adducin family protein [Alicyclobacillus ferrooxydans]|uniref:class II aldolase/adducin family protein n=1 Tax=Alicyclobacillus ferrooxydans TaxID=471514 RepID=UPI0006D5AE33|nr:class II aldolase/adducin family protein [Alicyclobacillus ferrooxydans]
MYLKVWTQLKFGATEEVLFVAIVAFGVYLGEYAVLLGNHGLLAAGPDIGYAFNTAEEIEFCAEVYYKAKLAGNPVLLSDSDMDTVIKKFKTYGQKPSL